MLFLRNLTRCQNVLKVGSPVSDLTLTDGVRHQLSVTVICRNVFSLSSSSDTVLKRKHLSCNDQLNNLNYRNEFGKSQNVHCRWNQFQCHQHERLNGYHSSGFSSLQSKSIPLQYNGILKRLQRRIVQDDHQHRLKSTVRSDEVKESGEETSKGWKEDIVFTVPNALTSSRIVLAPVLGYLVIQESFSWACGLFVFAGITDLLDGYIARNFPGQASAFGSYLDPLADKLLACILFMSLTLVDLIPVPLTALIITRDLFLISAAFVVRYITLPPPKTLQRYFDVTHATAQLQPTFISKLNTAVQLSLVTVTLGAPVFGYVDHALLQALWYITAGTTIASGITYIFAKDTVKILKQSKKMRKS